MWHCIACADASTTWIDHNTTMAVIFDSGHVTAAKPIYPNELWDSPKLPIKNYARLNKAERRTVMRTEWTFQGWSEIAAYHVRE
jgi:hypothetical protein